MFLEKLNIRKMYSVFFSVAIRSFLCVFSVKFFMFELFERKERERILHKVTFKKFVYPGGGFFIHLFRVHWVPPFLAVLYSFKSKFYPT